MTNELFLIKDLMVKCAEIGALECLKNLEPIKDRLTQNEAYRKYGAAWVKKRVREGVINKQRMGTSKNSPLCYSQSELKAALNAEKAIKLGIFDNTPFIIKTY